MTSSVPDTPPTEVSEADWAEQHIPAAPVEEEFEGISTVAGSIASEVNEADLAEQERIAYLVDDEEE